MADAVYDLQKALRTPTALESGRARADSDPGSNFPDNTTPRAMDIAVPGGFRRHHLQTQGSARPVSQALRDQIIDAINDVYDPVISSILSQDNDAFDELSVEDRVQSLLQTPTAAMLMRLPQYRRTPSRGTPTPTERTALVRGKFPLTGSPSVKATPPKAKRPVAPPREKTTTLWHALLTLLKSFVGTGILFLPDGFRSGGLLFSPLCLTLVAALTLYAMLRLLQCRALVGGTYGHIGFKAFGSWGKRSVQISIILMQAGFCCTYVIFVAQNMAQVLAYCGAPVSTSALILLQILVYIPLSWIRYISYFTISNLIADVFILYGLAYILGNSFSLLASEGPQEVTYFNERDYPVFVGTAVFTFEGIGLVIPTQTALNKARQAKFPKLLACTVVGLLFFYSFFAATNYVAIGNGIEAMVTSSLPRNRWSISVQFGYSCAQLLSYPLFLFPAVKIMEEMLGFPQRASGQKVAKNCFRAAVVVVTVSIAYFGQSRLDLFVSIVGAFCCVPLSFVYPPLFYMKLNPNAPLFEKVVDSSVVLIGLLTFFYVTYSNLKQWSA